MSASVERESFSSVVTEVVGAAAAGVVTKREDECTVHKPFSGQKLAGACEKKKARVSRIKVVGERSKRERRLLLLQRDRDCNQRLVPLALSS